jgi:hypothetical protein
MRYNLESTLPINAFSPRGGRGPFSRGMTLEGGGGGGIVGGITNPISKALGTSGGGGGILGGLASLDKTVGNTIPGGWGTLATVAASMVPGGQFAAMGLGKTAAMTGLGALTGSGALRPGGKFNLQGALMGGAAAYGMANLASGLEAAGGGMGPTASDVAAQLGVEGAGTGAGSQAAMLAEQAAGMGSQGLSNIASSAAPAIEAAQSAGFNYLPTGEMIPTTDLKAAIQPQPNVLSNFGTGVANQANSMGRGIANLSGLAGGEGAATAARTAFTGSGAGITNTAMPLLAGGTGLIAVDEQENYLNQQKAANAISEADYNSQMARVNTAKERARQAMQASPYQFANGGVVNPPDDQTEMPSQTPMQRLENGGMLGYADGGSIPGYAEGRFLSGGGDGLSDDIPAVIGGKQPAKLADGEFVISSDVVSNLGNGSSKAGAKKLYAMMDRVRQQAHGSKKQIRKVNANKVLPA